MSGLLFASIVFNFFWGLKISNQTEAQSRSRTTTIGIVINLSLLGFFKYMMFTLGILEDILKNIDTSFSIWKPEILLPVGISFYTFHNISYLIEVKNQKIQATKNFVSFAVYDVFFPLLLAGPIERPNSLIPQLESNRRISSELVYNGIALFLWGVFCKAAIADPLAKFVDESLSRTDSWGSGYIWIVAPAFAFQVYADFSGYSNCARGLANILGFQLMNNFHRPFFSSNPSEFWKRWHISLSTWLRDYVYIPLGGNQKGFVLQNVNIMIVWLLGGLWHGATYGYLIWGLYLGFCIVLYNLIKVSGFLSYIGSSYFIQTMGIFFTFFSFSFGLLLFRVESAEQLVSLFSNLLSLPDIHSNWLQVSLYCLPLLLFDLWQGSKQTKEVDFFLNERPYVFLSMASILFLVFCLVAPFEKQEFFYFQF
ncbi:MBOAT family O-acyltransferase [Leptospira ryugenii]|uniref:MBOAT family O-acyltransferase n=1 Tax=Leptospira ryugenii TaxID=1917863 RepID=UPI0026C2740A